MHRVTSWTTWWHEVVLGRVRLLRQVPLGGVPLVCGLVGVNIALGLFPVLFVVATSAVVGHVPAAVAGGVGSPGWTGLVWWFLAAAAALIGQSVLTPVQAALGEVMTRRVDGHLQRRLLRATLHTTGVAPLEDSATLDALDRVSRWFEASMHTPGSGSAGSLALVARYLRLLGLVVLLGFTASWPAAIVLAAVVLVFRTGQRAGMRVFVRVYDGEVGQRFRRAAYLRDVAVGACHAKELRVFGLTQWFFARYSESYRTATDEVARARRRVFFLPYLVYTAFGLAVASWAFADIGLNAARGSISLTGATLGLQSALAALLLGAQYPESDLQTALGVRALNGMDAFERRMTDAEHRTAAAEPAPHGAAGNGTTLAGRPAAVRLSAVHFGHPGAARPVLGGLDLELAAGQCTAVVGVNGAGKTTLVKLLTRLYEPTGGRITVDGVDIRTVPAAAWRRQVSVVFQDFVRYELSAAENIAYGAAHLPPDRAAVRAAAQRAGILPALDALPRGLDTILSRAYEGGADLSGGQWQRIAIARSLYALDAGARLLVLDEPTSALDVRAEASLFDSFVELTRRATTMLISHRFSSVRRADHIVVLDGGRVVERGAHDELMAVGGRYRTLFDLQAERFAAEGETTGLADGNRS